jgi:alkyl sulfatase BDS1-like metallo-beta-lactamase superfamily hydrolase
MTLDMYFDYLGVRLNAEKAQGKNIVLNWKFTDTRQSYVVNLENSSLTHVADAQAANADATLHADALHAGRHHAAENDLPGRTAVGDKSRSQANARSWASCWACSKTFTLGFPVVEPRTAH